MSIDSYTLFLQARQEMKAAGAWHEAALSAQRYIVELKEKRENAYLKALQLGVPPVIAQAVADNTWSEILNVREQGLQATQMANYHRDCAEALFVRRDKVLVREQRRFARGKS